MRIFSVRVMAALVGVLASVSAGLVSIPAASALEGPVSEPTVTSSRCSGVTGKWVIDLQGRSCANAAAALRAGGFYQKTPQGQSSAPFSVQDTDGDHAEHMWQYKWTGDPAGQVKYVDYWVVGYEKYGIDFRAHPASDKELLEAVKFDVVYVESSSESYSSDPVTRSIGYTHMGIPSDRYSVISDFPEVPGVDFQMKMRRTDGNDRRLHISQNINGINEEWTDRNLDLTCQHACRIRLEPELGKLAANVTIEIRISHRPTLNCNQPNLQTDSNTNNFSALRAETINPETEATPNAGLDWWDFFEGPMTEDGLCDYWHNISIYQIPFILGILNPDREHPELDRFYAPRPKYVNRHEFDELPPGINAVIITSNLVRTCGTTAVAMEFKSKTARKMRFSRLNAPRPDDPDPDKREETSFFLPQKTELKKVVNLTGLWTSSDAPVLPQVNTEIGAGSPAAAEQDQDDSVWGATVAWQYKDPIGDAEEVVPFPITKKNEDVPVEDGIHFITAPLTGDNIGRYESISITYRLGNTKLINTIYPFTKCVWDTPRGARVDYVRNNTWGLSSS